jgi:hypothetical protein
MSSETVAQTPSTKEDNVSGDPTAVPNATAVKPAEVTPTVPVEEKQTITLQEAVIQLEKLYTEKEEAVKQAQVVASQAQQALSQAERETLQVLRQLTPLQNRFLLNLVEQQKKQLDAATVAPAALPAVTD